MIISDLTYLENISEEPKLLGGYSYPVEVNLINARQLALSSAISFGFKADALATAKSLNLFLPKQEIA